MYRAEEPRVVESGEALYGLADRIAGWIADKARLGSEGAWIAGVYGARGSGKTSLLRTVYDILLKRKEDAGAGAEWAPCVLPEGKHQAHATFTPAATRAHDDILFMLLDHLKGRRRPARPLRGFGSARSAEVRRKDLARFLQYEQEIATSSRDIPRRLIQVHSDVAQTTSRLRRAFAKVLSSLKNDGEIFPILVDDLDLQPQRALELLEIFHLFMNVPGVVVLIAADKDLLLRSIERALKAKEHNVDHPGLASALLAKYVPHEWSLPTPSERERVDLLWGKSTVPVEGSELARWWQDDALQGLVEVRAARLAELQVRREYSAREGLNPEAARQDENEDPLPENARAMVDSALLPLAPTTYRSVKALHNRLTAWRERLEATHPQGSSVDFRNEVYRYDLGLNRYLASPFFAMMAGLDVRWPELELLTSLERSPTAFKRTLYEVAAMDSTPDAALQGDERRSLRLGERPEDLPVLGALLQGSHVAASDLGEAKRSLRHLARTWRAWQGRGAGVAGAVRFLVISVNSNALEASKRLWSVGFIADEVRDWHIDLRPLVHGDRPQPKELREARRIARAFLRDQKQISAFPGRLELFASAPSSFLLWLGWMLDREQTITVYNARTKKPFDGPAEALPFPDRSKYETAEVTFSVPSLSQSVAEFVDPEAAIAIIDLTLDHKSTARNLDRFQRDGVGVACVERCLLTRRSTEPIAQEDLLPILRDVLELVGQLRRDRGVRHLHLALAGPDVVAFFLGRQLKVQGMRISLYELYDDHHEYVFDLEEQSAGDG